MKVDLRKVLRVGVVLMALPMGGEALATCFEDCDPEPEPIPSTLPNCNAVSLGGITFSCPTGATKTRIVQVFNPALNKGTNARLACVCNGVFDRCNPNRPAGSEVDEGELEACDPGVLSNVPSEASLIGSNTSYCETSGGKKVCYNRR